ncbi:MAG TPA: class I adenylate-forming enzyme family protein [Candidatus Acidoferrales bacterium]|nr:class I adenylate-forming enzyme family protein [Candidatus Acidoferrales bacterium]
MKRLNAWRACATVFRVSVPRIANLGELLRQLAAQHGERPAVIGEHNALSFAALDRAADAWSGLVAAYGRGAHIGLLAGNGPAWLAVAFGVWRAGATLVPISTFVTARELGEVLEHADIDLLVVQPRLRAHDLVDLLDRTEKPRRLRDIMLLDSPLPPRPPGEGRGEGISGTPDPASIACILYTSGTTGEPKGVMLSHRAILATTLPTAERTGLTDSDALLSTLPLFWVAGLVIRALPTLATGCALILVETFTVDAVLAALRRHRPTALHLRPPQVGQILAHPDFDPSLLAAVCKGGGRADWYAPHLRDARLITGYGMTEAAGYVTALHWRDPPEIRRTQIGTALPGVEIRILDEAGRPCPPEQVGEVRVRGPGLFSGYYKQPPLVGLDADGFFITGDLGRIDAQGIFHFVGRSKDLLRVKGINVSPMEVEAVLGTHPAVEAAYVVGLPPDGLDQQLAALIVTRQDQSVTETELRALAAAALSHYKRPERYVFIEPGAVPLSGTAKPQRAALARLAVIRLRGAPIA